MSGPKDTESNATRDVLTVYMAKYGSLRAETASRFQFQAQAYNFLVVVLTAAAVAAASLLGSGRADRLEHLVLALPLVAGLLGYLYVSNDLMIFGIAGYLDAGLSRDVSALLGREVVLSDARLNALSRRGRVTLAALAYSRWLLFVVPTLAPVIYAVLAIDAWREFPLSLLFAADCLIALGLLAAIWVTTREQLAWRRQHAPGASQARKVPGHPPAASPAADSSGPI